MVGDDGEHHAELEVVADVGVAEGAAESCGCVP